MARTITRTATVPFPASRPTCTHKRVDLFNSMATGTEITSMSKPDSKLHTGIVQAIEREDGSGYRFLVRLHNSTKIHYVVVL
jgi:hypothetical protein